MDWSQCPEAERVPGKVSGAWLVRGSRVQADAIVANFDDGFTAQEIVDDIFEGLTIEQVKTILAFAKRYEAHPA